MPRLRRWLFALIALLSLSLCICSIIAWRISYRTTIPAIPSTSTAQDMLATPLPPLHFNNALLSDVIAFLSDIRGVKMEMDWPAIEAVNVERYALVSTPNLDPSASFSTYSKQERLGVTLASLLSSLNPRLQFVVDGDTIRITAKGAPKSDKGRQFFPENDAIRRMIKQLGPSPLTPKPHEFVLFNCRFTPVADRGTFRLWLTPADPAAIYQDGTPIGSAATPTSDFRYSHAGFSLKGARSPFNTYLFELPFWATTFLTAILPLLWLYKFIRRHRLSPGHCPKCNYDLRATPDHCPECGHISTPAKIISSPSVAPPVSPPSGNA